MSRRYLIYGGAVILGVMLGSLLFLWRSNALVQVWGQPPNKVEPRQVLEPLDPLFPSPDKTSYTMALSLDVEHLTLVGRTHIKTVNTSGGRLNQLWLTAYPNIFRHKDITPVPITAYEGNFAPGYLEFTGAYVNGKAVVVGNQNVSVQLDIGEAIKPDAPVEVDLAWILHLPPVAYRLGYQQGVFMLGNFYPSLEMYNRQGWHHSPEVKFGDPFCFAAADYTVALTVPGGYQVVAGADLINRLSDDRGMETWIFASNQARDFAFAAFLPGFNMEKRQVGNIEVQVWGKSQAALASTANVAAKVLSYYQEIFTPFPHKQLKLVEVPMQGFMGMEYDGLIFLSDRAMSASYSPEQRSHLVAHEIAHQWWYALVGNDQALEPWLDEGLSSWSAQLYARKQGEAVGSAKQSSRQMAWPLTAFTSREQYMTAVYNGGDWFWQQVENQVGQPKLLRGLQAYLQACAGQVASTGDMFSALMQAGVDRDVLYSCWQRR